MTLALHYSAGLCVAAAVMVGVLYLVLSSALDVETTQRRTVTESTPHGQVNAQQEDTIESEEAIERRVADETLNRLRNASLVVLGGLFGASLVAGWIIAGRVLAPIEAAMATQNRFVRDASHELRNPLAVMRTSLDLALEDPATPSATWRQVGRSVRDTVDRMTNVVDTLLRTARHDAPATPATQIDVAAMLRRVAAQVQPSAAGRNITVVAEAQSSHLTVDRAAIERAVVNLVDNALRHAPPGSTVTISGLTSTDSYDIRVHDTGPGIRPEHLDTVFARGHRSPDSPGLGLGLAIARDIVNAHNGHISIETSGAAGTTFLISLPTPQSTDHDPPG